MVCPFVQPAFSSMGSARVALDPSFFGFQFCSCSAPYRLQRSGGGAVCTRGGVDVVLVVAVVVGTLLLLACCVLMYFLLRRSHAHLLKLAGAPREAPLPLGRDQPD